MTSLEKYTPSGATVNLLDDQRVEMHLDEKQMRGDADFDTLRAAFEQWKEQQPFTETREKTPAEAVQPHVSKTIQTQPQSGPSRITEVMQMILSFPIEQRSPMQSMQFLAEIKAYLTKMI